MRLPGGHFLNNLRTRIPWVVAILALVIAASTGTYWATSRIRSLDTDLTTAGKQSKHFRDQMSRVTAANSALQDRLEGVEAALSQATETITELKAAKRELRHCVSKSNPEGGPIVTLVPDHGPVGTRVEMTGSCFTGQSWKRKDPPLSALLATIDDQGRVIKGDGASCELIAGFGGHLHVNRAGRMHGHFIVPSDGVCFQQKNDTSRVVPGPYSLIIGCHACTVGEFRVTTEAGERRRLDPCRRGDYRWFLQGPDGSRAMHVFGVQVELARGAACRITESLSVTITSSSGTPLGISGSPASVRFDAALGRQRTSAAWAWQNWCGTEGPFEFRAVLGTESKSKSFGVSPRCNSKKFESRLRSLGPWMDGVSSHTP